MIEVVRVDPREPAQEAIARAADCLREGGLVAFPTETVYGLGVNALDEAAVRRLFEVKGRPANDPLIVHVASFDQIGALVSRIPSTARDLAARFWPGPLTLVMPRSTAVSDAVTAGLDTVAIRIPSHPVAHALLSAAGVPVAAPSANLFSRPSPTTAAHVLEDLDGRIEMVLDGGPTHVGVESTVLDLSHGAPTILRPGWVDIDALRTVLPRVDVRPSAPDSTDAMASPGMLERHYSPRAPLTLYEGNTDAAIERMVTDAREAHREGARIGVLTVSDLVERLRGRLAPRVAAHIEDAGAASDLPEIAARLYAALRAFDAARVDVILAHVPSVATGLGAAIRDRLYRAAAGRIKRT